MSFEWKGDIPRLLSLGGGGGGGGALHRGGPGPGAMMPRPNAGRGMYGAPGMTATFPRPIATPLMMPMPGGVGPGIGGGGLGGGVGASLQQTQIKVLVYGRESKYVFLTSHISLCCVHFRFPTIDRVSVC